LKKKRREEKIRGKENEKQKMQGKIEKGKEKEKRNRYLLFLTVGRLAPFLTFHPLHHIEAL
jgi:hypothetical protein